MTHPTSLLALRRQLLASTVLSAAALLLAPVALAAGKPLPARHAEEATHWVGTWAAAPSAEAYKGGSIAAPLTLRQIVHVSRGGTRLRVTFSNELGVDPLTITAAHVARSAGGSDTVPGSDQVLSFGGQPSIVIPPGAVALSDAVDLKLPPTSDLAISLSLPAQPLHVVTAHPLALQTGFQVPGDVAEASTLRDAEKRHIWWFLKNVEVQGSAADGAIVTLGDSITDGARSTPDTNRRWPDILASRLQASGRLSGMAVLNEGISGNRILHDQAGPNALARFDRDVLSQSGVRYLIILEGINDIGRTAQPRNPGDEVTAQQITVALGQMIDRAHAHGIKVIGATLTPFLGAGYQTDAGEKMRETVNDYIRASGKFDGVIDFDRVTADPSHPGVYQPAFDSGDHLHPGDAGYKAMGDSIDLKLFER